jgi:hypothetical protein
MGVTQGTHAMAALVARFGAAHISRKIGSSDTSVRYYATGQRTPSAAQQFKIQDIDQIAVTAWAVPSEEPLPEMPQARPAPAKKRRKKKTGDDSAKQTALDMLQTCRDELAKLEADATATPKEKAPIIQRTLEIRSAPFQRALAIVKRVLEKYPEAAKELAIELEAYAKGEAEEVT